MAVHEHQNKVVTYKFNAKPKRLYIIRLYAVVVMFYAFI